MIEIIMDASMILKNRRKDKLRWKTFTLSVSE
jgi:hypothetical protein